EGWDSRSIAPRQSVRILDMARDPEVGGFLRRAMLPQILQLGGQGAPQQVDVVEAHDRGAYGLAVGPGALRMLLKALEELLEFGAGCVRGAGGEGAAVGGGAPAQAQELIQRCCRAPVDA